MTVFNYNALNKIINTYLKLDPDSMQRLQKLHHKIVHLQLKPLGIHLALRFDDDALHVAENDFTENAHVTLRGTPLRMLHAMCSDDRQSFFAEDLEIEGDAMVAQDLLSLFDHMNIDWTEHLSTFVGDVPAQYAERLKNKIARVAKHTLNTFTENVDEYVHEEKVWLPQRAALEDFFADVDELRMAVDRLEARINLLKKAKL